MRVNKAKKVSKFLKNMPPPILKLPQFRQFLIFFDNSFSVDLHFTNNLRLWEKIRLFFLLDVRVYSTVRGIGRVTFKKNTSFLDFFWGHFFLWVTNIGQI